MRNSKRLIICTILVGVATISIAASATRRGSSVLHYMTRTPLTATEDGSAVAASLRLQHNEQGHSSLQKFDLTATGLLPNTAYFLVAAFDSETNVVGTSNSDANGKLRVAYMKKGQGNGNSEKALPESLDPVSGIRGIALQNPDTQTVAFAFINTSPKFQYLVKRNLTQGDTNASPAGSISLKVNASSVNFRLLADGLSAASPYLLALNSNIVATVASDDGGGLEIDSWPASAPAVLDLRSLSLLDGASNVVLSTTVPK